MGCRHSEKFNKVEINEYDSETEIELEIAKIEIQDNMIMTDETEFLKPEIDRQQRDKQTINLVATNTSEFIVQTYTMDHHGKSVGDVSIKDKASKLLLNITELTKDVCNIIISYITFEPDDIILKLDDKSLKNYQNAINDYGAVSAWVITEKQDNIDRYSDKKIISVYYCNPMELHHETQQEYVMIGQCLYLNDIVYFILEGKESTIQSDFSWNFYWKGKLTLSSTWKDLYLYGLPNDDLREKCTCKGWGN